MFATPRPHGPGIEDIALARLGLQRRVAVRCQHAITAWQIVAKTDMLCTLPRSHVRMLQDIWPMQLFDLPIAVAQSSSYLYWHRAVQADAGLAWLRAIILECAYPNRLGTLADVALHMTPERIAQELPKLPAGVPVWIYHIKPQFYDEIADELSRIDPARVSIVEQDKTYSL